MHISNLGKGHAMVVLWAVGLTMVTCQENKETTCKDQAPITSSLMLQVGNVHAQEKNHSILGSNTAELEDSLIEEVATNEDLMKQALACARDKTCGADEYMDIAKETTTEVMTRALGKMGMKMVSINALSSISAKAETAEKLGKVLHMLLDKLLKNAATRSKISIHNRLTEKLTCTGTHSYQMNLWDNQFPDLMAWEGKDVNTWTSGNTVGWGDTNAEAYYTVWCPQLGRNVNFKIMIRHQHWIRFQWDDQDVYNPCYDMWVEGNYFTSENYDRRRGQYKKSHTIAYSSAPILVVGSAQVPNKETHVTLKLHPHVADTRYPVLYEHTNFHGVSHAMKLPFTANLQGFNDKASSLRVPPGTQVAVCEHENFKGNCPIFNQDTASIPMQDAATSAIWIVNKPGK
jgi:hypothetical protein